MWRKIEVGVERQEGKDKTYDKRLATELVRQLEIVTIRDPTLAQYVQYVCFFLIQKKIVLINGPFREVSICLNIYSMDTVFPELVRALHMFSNMHSLQIISRSSLVQRGLFNAFKGHTFPTVRRLALNGAAHPLVKSCPQVQAFYTNEHFRCGYVWQEVVQNWEGITKVHGLMVPDRYTLGEGAAFPITVFTILTHPFLTVTAKLRHLKYLEVDADDLLLKSDGAIDLVSLFSHYQMSFDQF
jgi:hypothetical protein